MTGIRTDSGENLRRKWNIPARQVRYHKDGTWFMPLERFPAALCDPRGYVLFPSKELYESSRYLHVGERINVRGGISRVPGYVRKK